MAQLNLVIRFVVELLGLGFVGYAAWTLAGPGLLGWIAAGIAVVAFAALWGLFFSPRADRGLSWTQKDIGGMVVLLLAAGALAATGQVTAAVIYAVVVIVNAALLFLVRDDVARVVPGVRSD